MIYLGGLFLGAYYFFLFLTFLVYFIHPGIPKEIVSSISLISLFNFFGVGLAATIALASFSSITSIRAIIKSFCSGVAFDNSLIYFSSDFSFISWLSINPQRAECQTAQLQKLTL